MSELPTRFGQVPLRPSTSTQEREFLGSLCVEVRIAEDYGGKRKLKEEAGLSVRIRGRYWTTERGEVHARQSPGWAENRYRYVEAADHQKSYSGNCDQARRAGRFH